METLSGGWHELTVPHARPGDRYEFVLPDGKHVPDPASRYQPEDVHGPSEVIDPAAYDWKIANWRGRRWHEAIIYELHVGTFTTEGTLLGAIERLDHLVELGVTAVELMPIADFPGTRNWGYDGVLLFAPDASYGRPEDLKAFIDAAHERGLMVFLDVVYNHFGPDGNYLAAYAPQIFTDRHKTAWGDAINYDGDGSETVRELVIQNALFWLEEYQFDGLRLDAVHAILDDSQTHILEELAARVRKSFGGRRHVHLILENDKNEAVRLQRSDNGSALGYSAQWNDDLHHTLHVAATGEERGYYADYTDGVEKLARSLAEGFVYQGEKMLNRDLERGQPSAQLPATAFVSFIQNHHQIGNRPFGDRVTALAPREAVRAIAAIYLLAPQTPMLFMGEEWAASEPFPYFCDFDGDLGEAIRSGRRAEFSCFAEFQDEEMCKKIPDPTALETFRAAKLDWEAAYSEPHASWLKWYRRILNVRRREVVPLLADAAGHSGYYKVFDERSFAVRWRLGGHTLGLSANLSSKSRPSPLSGERVIWREGLTVAGGEAGPWTVAWTITSA